MSTLGILCHTYLLTTVGLFYANAGSSVFGSIVHGYGEVTTQTQAYFGGFQEGLKHGPGLVVWRDGNLKLGYWHTGKLLYGFQHWIKDNNVTIQDWKEKPRAIQAIHKHKHFTIAVMHCEAAQDTKELNADWAAPHMDEFEFDPAVFDVHALSSNVLCKLDGGIYFGSTLGRKPHGYGEWSSSKGELFMGGFQKGHRHGPGLLQRSDGSLSIGYWESDICRYEFQFGGDSVTMNSYRPYLEIVQSRMTLSMSPSVISIIPEPAIINATPPPQPLPAPLKTPPEFLSIAADPIARLAKKNV
jgi:hypothetical protein